MKHESPILYRLGLSVAAFGFATLLTWGLWFPIMSRVPFAMYFAAVSIVAWLCGFFPGLAVAILGTVSVKYLSASAPLDTLQFCVLLLIAALMSYLAGRRRQSESRFALEAERIKSVVNHVVDGIFTLNGRLEIESWNPAARLIFGFQPEEVIGKTVTILMPRHLNSHTAEEFVHQLCERQNAFGIGQEVLGQRKDGEVFPMEIAISEFRMGSQKFYTGIIRDISERKKVLESLRDSEERYRITAEAASDAILTISEDGMILFANRAATVVFGYLGKELEGNNLTMLMPKHLRALHAKGLREYVRTGTKNIPWNGVELIGVHKDGHEFPIDVSFGEYHYGGQRVFSGIIRDITDRKQVETELMRAKEAAEAANAAKSAFLANMSHEIRTPLGAVLGFSELLVNPEVSRSEKVNYGAAMKRNGELLSAIINDILDLSKIEAGKMEIEPRQVALSEILTDLTTLLHLQATEKGIRLTVASEGKVPEYITSDSLRLRQILLNIVGNAIKFTDKGTVNVSIKFEAKGKLNRLLFLVEDTGKGMTKAQSERLFEPFSQADPSTKRRFGGTGLGLALSKRLAKLLGGDVTLVRSESNKGSTFLISIDPGPVSSASLQQIGESTMLTQALNDRADANINLEGINVLVADDAPDNQILVSRLLRLSGASVDTASNGLDALEKTRKRDYDVLLMDLQMPIMDGYEATAELRRQGFITPIIALTAHALKEERQRCLDSGFNDHLSKPINRRALIESIAHHSCRKLTNFAFDEHRGV